jgi:hypothetical protein
VKSLRGITGLIIVLGGFYTSTALGNCYVLENDTNASIAFQFHWNVPVPAGGVVSATVLAHQQYPLGGGPWCFNGTGSSGVNVLFFTSGKLEAPNGTLWHGPLMFGDGQAFAPEGTYSIKLSSDSPGTHPSNPTPQTSGGVQANCANSCQGTANYGGHLSDMGCAIPLPPGGEAACPRPNSACSCTWHGKGPPGVHDGQVFTGFTVVINPSAVAAEPCNAGFVGTYEIRGTRGTSIKATLIGPYAGPPRVVISASCQPSCNPGYGDQTSIPYPALPKYEYLDDAYLDCQAIHGDNPCVFDTYTTKQQAVHLDPQHLQASGTTNSNNSFGFVQRSNELKVIVRGNLYKLDNEPVSPEVTLQSGPFDPAHAISFNYEERSYGALHVVLTTKLGGYDLPINDFNPQSLPAWLNVKIDTSSTDPWYRMATVVFDNPSCYARP